MERLELEFTVGEVRKEKEVSKKLERSRKQEERSKKNKSERSGSEAGDQDQEVAVEGGERWWNGVVVVEWLQGGTS